MSIYSANRSGSMTMSQVRANESYTSNDLGRILYESQVNDMAFFEAILAADFKEIKSLREGTILESEIRSLNEASFKTIISNLKERLKKFWAKIKAAFKDVMTKIAAYVFRDGKAFVKNFWSVYNQYEGWTGSIPDVKRYDSDSIKKSYAYINVMVSEFEVGIRDEIKNKSYDSTLTKNDYIKDFMKEALGDENISTSDFVKKALEQTEETVTVKASSLKDLCKVIEEGKSSINSIKKTESELKRTVDKVNNALVSAENKSKSDDRASNVSYITTMYSSIETIITLYTKFAIAAVKADVKSCRTALGLVMSDLRKNGKKKGAKAGNSVSESCYLLEAEDEIEAAFSDAPDELDSNTQDFVDDMISEDNDD